MLDDIRQALSVKSRARDAALVLSREAIRVSANAIRALHRHEFEPAEALAAEAAGAVRRAAELLAEHQDVLHAGFIHDAAKEVAEAHICLALVRDHPLPTQASLGVEAPAYLNGLAEAIGELRRHLLDALRAGDVDTCERLLDKMDEIYTELGTIDFPDALTGGLRRATDAARAILERTRGDLTLAVRQRDLERHLDRFSRDLRP
jgi:translin